MGRPSGRPFACPVLTEHPFGCYRDGFTREWCKSHASLTSEEMGDQSLPPGLMGFLPPWSVFVGNLAAPERSYLTTLLRGLKASYPHLVEPAAGSFAVATIARDLGWGSASIDCSDVSLYSTAIGEALCGRDLATLDVRLDGAPLPLAGPPTRQAALILLAQLELRTAKKATTDYMVALLDDLCTRRGEHLDALQRRLDALAAKLGPIFYRPLDLFAHLAEVADDPRAVVVLNPPTYRAGYEKFFDTAGRLTWNEPPYAMFDPTSGVEQLLASVDDSAALVVCLQQAPNGNPSREPVYARASTPAETVYYLANRPAEVLTAAGRVARPRPPRRHERPPGPLLPPDHPITEQSVAGVAPLRGAQADYLKHVWAHRIKPGTAIFDFALILDGHIAAVSGYDHRSTAFGSGRTDALLIVYTFAAPHHARLVRLLVAMACQRSTIDAVRTPSSALWVDSCGEVFTVMLTAHPEVKAQRGLMKLAERKPDQEHGFRLHYSAPITSRTPAEVFADWWKKEQQWQKSRAVSK